MVGKIEFRGARGPFMVVNIVANYRCKRKMLKETETEKRLTFLSHFVIVDISVGGVAGPPASWLRLWGRVPYGKFSHGYCITFIERLVEGLR